MVSETQSVSGKHPYFDADFSPNKVFLLFFSLSELLLIKIIDIFNFILMFSQQGILLHAQSLNNFSNSRI